MPNSGSTECKQIRQPIREGRSCWTAGCRHRNRAINQSSKQASKQASNQAINQSSNQSIKQASNQSIRDFWSGLSGMPLLGPLLGIRLLEQKCFKSLTECYQGFWPRWHDPVGCSILVDRQHWMPGHRRSTVVWKVRLVGWQWQSEVSVDLVSRPHESVARDSVVRDPKVSYIQGLRPWTELKLLSTGFVCRSVFSSRSHTLWHTKPVESKSKSKVKKANLYSALL